MKKQFDKAAFVRLQGLGKSVAEVRRAAAQRNVKISNVYIWQIQKQMREQAEEKPKESAGDRPAGLATRADIDRCVDYAAKLRQKYQPSEVPANGKVPIDISAKALKQRMGIDPTPPSADLEKTMLRCVVRLGTVRASMIFRSICKKLEEMEQ